MGNAGNVAAPTNILRNLTDDLTNDYVYAGNPGVGGIGPGELTIIGLTPGGAYDIYVYSTMSRDSQISTSSYTEGSV